MYIYILVSIKIDSDCVVKPLLPIYDDIAHIFASK